MKLCIYRIEQREHNGTHHFCRKDLCRCGSALQLACTAGDVWPVWLVAAFLVVGLLYRVTG